MIAQAGPRFIAAPNTWHAVRPDSLHLDARGPERQQMDNAAAVSAVPRLHELLYQYRPKPGSDGRPVYLGRPLRHSADAAPLLAKLLASEPVEVCGVLCLTTTCHVICWHQVSRGWLDGTYVEPREVFQTALLTNAASIILAHNHPSGDPTPSPLDLDVTKRLIKTGSLIGVPIVDHIIIGDGAFTSVRRASLPARQSNAAYAYANELSGTACSAATDDIVCRRDSFILSP
jgi:DNA repair protein RadC